jgi:TusA-related sulfurtransferase
VSQSPAARLDITLDICPMTFVKTKLELEDLAPGDLLEVRLRDGEPLRNVLRSCEEEGHEIVSRVATEDGIWQLLVRRGANP